MNIRSIIRSLTSSRWDIGIITTPIEDILNGCDIKVRWIKNHFAESWFADPFILDETENEFIILAEEFYKPINRGRISKLWVDKKTLTILRKKVLLELNTHLSFPAFCKKGKDIFIYPENSMSGHLYLYKLFNDMSQCERIATLSNKALVDAVQTDLFGENFLFATSLPYPNGKVLEIHRWDNSKGIYVDYQNQEFNENVARMSGCFFKYNGKIYRPTQECNTQYGHAVTIQEVKRNNNGNFIFKEIRRLYSVHPKYKIGMHTFNFYKDGVIMTDALTFDRMWMRKFLTLLHILPKR